MISKQNSRILPLIGAIIFSSTLPLVAFSQDVTIEPDAGGAVILGGSVQVSEISTTGVNSNGVCYDAANGQLTNCDTGIVGPAGPTGPAGPAGPLGPQGPAGIDGLEGPVGPTGPEGPAGMAGLDGPVGPVGPMGPAGTDGLEGPPGPVGEEGPMGVQGPAGLDGTDGGITYTADNGIQIVDGATADQKIIRFASGTGTTRDLNNMQPSFVLRCSVVTEGTFPARDFGPESYIGSIGFTGYNFSPLGSVECDGRLLAINVYSALFALIGTTFGGDGQTTFGIPDLRGRTPVGQGTGTGLTQRRVGEMLGAETTSTLNQ